MIRIEKAGVESVPLIRKLALDIWPQSHGKMLSAAQIKYMLQLLYSEDALRRQIQDGQQFYIVYDNEQAVGFFAFGLYETGVYKLHKIYLLPQKQGSGLGKYMLQFVIDEAKTAGAKALILNVNRQNNAFHFYKKTGFEIIETTDIDIGEGFWMNDYIMQLML